MRGRAIQSGILLVLVVAACEGKSGLRANRSDAGAETRVGLPADDGTCPEATSLCGTGAGARCLSLADDPMNCGACGRACTPGIACVAGVCQNARCEGSTSFHKIAGYPKSIPDSLYLAADQNRDGRFDVIEYQGDGAKLTLWLGNPDGTFTATTQYPTPGTAQTWSLPDYAAVGDFNEDGLSDLVVTNDDRTIPRVRPGLPGGGFGGAPGTPAYRLEMGDLDGDGHLDVATSEPHDDGPSQILIWRGLGNGAFAGPSRYAIRDEYAGVGAVLDWNRDGALDILAGTWSGLHILLGAGDGSFPDDQDCGVAGGVVADLNQDGNLDIVWRIYSQQEIATMLGQGGCNFAPRASHAFSTDPLALVVGDVTGDGFPDVLVTRRYAQAALLVTNPDGTLAAPIDVAIDTSDVLAMWIADVTGDGHADVITSGARGIEVYAQACNQAGEAP
jgi:hypothetical protein